MSTTGQSDSPSSLTEVEDLLERFDEAWQSRHAPRLEEFLPPLPADAASAELSARRRILEELIKIDLEYRWRGRRRTRATARDGTTVREKPPNKPTPPEPLPDRPHLEDYVRQFPELGALVSLPLELIGEEYRVRQRWGDRPSHEIYAARFAERGEVLMSLLRKIDAEIARLPADETRRSQSDVMLAPSQSGTSQGASGEPPELPAAIGRYEIRGHLGRGAFGSVYLAFDADLSRHVAIKVPRTQRIRSQKDVQAIFREARLAAQLRHPGLVQVFDVGREPDGRCYIVMEYIEGEPLSDRIKRERVDQRQAVQWMFHSAEAIHCAHKVGLVHGDLKPGNILIDREGRPHVADFGLAVSEVEQRRMAGHVAGTPAYMAPEQIRGETHRLDGRTDLWALGVMLYELLTGRLPFGGETINELFDEIVNRDPKPPRQIDDCIPPDLEWVCLKCLTKSIADRYTTAMDLARDLYQVLESASASHGASSQFGGRSVSTLSSAWSQHRHAPLTNLPEPATSFVGREAELAKLEELLVQPEVWLVTLTGPGGIGKTRIAQHIATDLLDQFPGGCWFAELAEARTAPRIAEAVARAFGVPLTGSEPPEQAVANVLEYRKPLLLVLDNFEQAVEHAFATVGVWRTRAPHVTFLATSRSPLGLGGEREFELGPLPAPAEAAASAASVAHYDAVKLFCDRARQVHPAFTLDDENAAAVARICSELDGIPLAVELAAARAKILKPSQMSAKLGQRFQLLQSPRRDLTPRQQTLLGAIDWSYNLLNDWEQQAFMQCSILRGGFFLDAAEGVIDLSACPNAPLALDAIQSLREKSLLTRTDTRYETRFSMYQSIREYAEQKWLASASADEQRLLAERFARYLLDYAEGWNRRIHTADCAEALDRLQLETVNLFAIQDWALDTGAADLAARAVLALARTMAIRGPADRRVARLDRSLAALALEAVELRVRLMTALSEACHAVGQWDRAVSLADEAVQLAQTLGRGLPWAEALEQQGIMRRHRGDMEAAHACFVQSESMYRELGHRQGVASSLANRGVVVWQRGDPNQALRSYDEAEQIAHAIQDPIATASIARHRGHVLWQRGDHNGALRCYAEAEGIARSLADERTIHLTIGNRGIVLAERGDLDGALQCYAEAEAIARRLGDKRGIAINVGNRGIALSDRGDPKGALACYTEAEAINRQMQTKFGIAVNLANRGNALADLGDYEGALRSLAEAEAINREMGNKFLYALNIGDRGSALLKMGRPADARESLWQALAILNEMGMQQSPEYFGVQSLLVQAEQQLGNANLAQHLARETLQMAESLGLADNHPKLRIREQLVALRELAKPG